MWTSFSTAWRAASSRGGEERADIDIEAEIGEGRGDHLLAAVVTVLAHLGDEDAGAAPIRLLEGLDQPPHPLDRRRHAAHLPLVDARDRPDLGPVPAPGPLQSLRDLTDRGLGPRRLDGEREQVAAAFRRLGQRRESRLDLLPVALGAQALELVDLERADVAVVDPQQSIARSPSACSG